MATTYAKLYHDILGKPKFQQLSFEAFGLWSYLLLQSGQYRTDGCTNWLEIRRLSLGKRHERNTKRALGELVSAGLVDKKGDDYRISKYLRHNKSKKQIDEIIEQKREAGAIGGRAKPKQSAKHDAKQSAKHDGQARYNTDTNTKTKTDTNTGENLNAMEVEQSLIELGWHVSAKKRDLLLSLCPIGNDEFDNAVHECKSRATTPSAAYVLGTIRGMRKEKQTKQSKEKNLIPVTPNQRNYRNGWVAELMVHCTDHGFLELPPSGAVENELRAIERKRLFDAIEEIGNKQEHIATEHKWRHIIDKCS